MEFTVEDSWGVGSFRQCAGFPCTQKDMYCTPLGCCIVQWHITTKEKSMFQAHEDLITVLLKNCDKLVLSVSMCGEIKIWDANWTIMALFKLPTSNVIYGSWSKDGKMLSVCSKGPEQMLIVYDLNAILECYTTFVNCRWQYRAPQTPAHTGQSEVVCNVEKQKSYDCFNASVFKENGEVIAIYQSSSCCFIYLFSVDGELLKIQEVSPLGDEKNVMLCVSEVNDNLICVGLQHGVFGFYNATSLIMSAVIQATGSPQVCMWYRDELFTMSYLSGVMSFWSKEGMLLGEITGCPSESIVHMNPSLTPSSFWIAGIMSLHQVTISHESATVIGRQDLSFLSLTGCGVAVSENNLVASGDFTGKVLLWEYNKPLPIKKVLLPSPSIRCLLWYRTSLLIGLLDGCLYGWSYITSGTVHPNNSPTLDDCTLKLLYSFTGGVVSVQLNSTATQLAAATTAGYLHVFTIDHENNEILIKLIFSSLQHKPKIQPNGEKLNMEIWSLTWSVNDNMIATTSEDKTCAVASSETGQILHVLSGHTTAVTSVDWKLLSNNNNILATCADDQTVRIYDGVTFTLIKMVDTYSIYGWHTLTYMCIQPKRNLLICATQNGYLVVWNLDTFECLTERKIHGGSIEGLALDKNEQFVFTTSSDCVVNRLCLSCISEK